MLDLVAARCPAYTAACSVSPTFSPACRDWLQWGRCKAEQAVVASAGVEIWAAEDATLLAAAVAALIGMYVGLRCLGRQAGTMAESLAWARANSFG
jgi:hypothetical protein